VLDPPGAVAAAKPDLLVRPDVTVVPFLLGLRLGRRVASTRFAGARLLLGGRPSRWLRLDRNLALPWRGWRGLDRWRQVAREGGRRSAAEETGRPRPVAERLSGRVERDQVAHRAGLERLERRQRGGLLDSRDDRAVALECRQPGPRAAVGGHDDVRQVVPV